MIGKEVQERLESLRAAMESAQPILVDGVTDDEREAIRQRHDRERARFLPPAGITFDTVNMGGVAATVAAPATVRDGRTLLYLHGGGYFSSSSTGYRGIVGHYAELLSARVFVPDYRLAPEQRFPAALEDAVDSYRWLVGQGVPGSRIAIAGDSAGGAMVVSTIVRARNAGIALPVGGVALSPWANLEMTGSSYVSRAGLDPLNSREALVSMARTVLGDELPDNPEASPVSADVRGLPPILIHIGENEVMLSDAMRLATHLAEHRVRTSLEVWPGMFHVWHLFADVLPEGREALRSSARFLEGLYCGAPSANPAELG